MNNGDRPAYPVVYEHDDATSEQPGLTKEEYARIEVAKAIITQGRVHFNDVAGNAKAISKELFEGGS